MILFFVSVVSGFSSYEEQNGFELQQLLATFSGDRNAVIMGDLGTSPSLPEFDINALFSTNFKKLETFEFTSPAVRLGHCTYCATNSMNSASGSGQSTIQDHILLHKKRKSKIKAINVSAFLFSFLLFTI